MARPRRHLVMAQVVAADNWAQVQLPGFSLGPRGQAVYLTLTVASGSQARLVRVSTTTLARGIDLHIRTAKAVRRG